ncbi:MAG: beta-lactamase family protein [Hyphomicrobiales bacterium]|nr:beta-lactamase family protein [Hyphomicrobiales bacterium]
MPTDNPEVFVAVPTRMLSIVDGKIAERLMNYEQRYKRIDAIARNHVESGHFSGIEWLVVHKGNVWSKGRAGMADALNNIEMPSSPIYRVYSMTKPVISAIALMLMEEGKLRLFDPVAKFLPQLAAMEIIDDQGSARPVKTPILIEHLLTHRAGFSYGFLADCPVGRIYRKSRINDASLSLAGMVEIIAAMPLAFEPGSQWRYSVATDILARVIEIALDQPLPAILKERIFDPLDMGETGFSVPESEQHRIMAVFGKSDLDYLMDFDDKPQTLIAADLTGQYPSNDPAFWRGGYGLFSTIDDYAKLTGFLASGETAQGDPLLSRKTMQLMWTNRIRDNQLPLCVGPVVLPGYGYGLAGRVMIDPGGSLGLTSMGEFGWAGAASTYFWIDREEDLIGITMAQYLGGKIPLGDDIRTAVYQALE